MAKRSYPQEDNSLATRKGVRGSSCVRYGEVGSSLLDSGDAALSWDDIEPHSVDQDPEIVDHLRRFGGL